MERECDLVELTLNLEAKNLHSELIYNSAYTF